MTVPEEEYASSTDRLLDFVRTEETRDIPRFATAALALVAAVLVAASTLTAVETGHTAIGLSFLAAVGLFTGTVAVFEAGRRIGADR
jgi:hypothetical protein